MPSFIKDLDKQRRNPAVFDLADTENGQPKAWDVKIQIILVVDSLQDMENHEKRHESLHEPRKWISYLLCEQDRSGVPEGISTLSMGMKRDYVKLCGEKFGLQRYFPHTGLINLIRLRLIQRFFTVDNNIRKLREYSRQYGRYHPSSSYTQTFACLRHLNKIMSYETAPPEKVITRKEYIDGIDDVDGEPCLKTTLLQCIETMEYHGSEARDTIALMTHKLADRIVKQDREEGYPGAKHPELLISKFQNADCLSSRAEVREALVQAIYNSMLFEDSRHIGMVSILNRLDGHSDMQRRINTETSKSHEVSHNISKVSSTNHQEGLID